MEINTNAKSEFITRSLIYSSRPAMIAMIRDRRRKINAPSLGLDAMPESSLFREASSCGAIASIVSYGAVDVFDSDTCENLAIRVAEVTDLEKWMSDKRENKNTSVSVSGKLLSLSTR